MSKESSKQERKQTRNSATAKGLYDKVRSKFVKGKDGYGAVISVAREKLIEKNGGKDPGSDTVAFHVTGGAHNNHSTRDEAAIWTSKGKNTAESNMRRSGKSKKEIMSRLKLRY